MSRDYQQTSAIIEFRKKNGAWEWRNPAGRGPSNRDWHTKQIVVACPGLISFQMPKQQQYFLQTKVTREKIDSVMTIGKPGQFTIQVWKQGGMKKPRQKAEFVLCAERGEPAGGGVAQAASTQASSPKGRKGGAVSSAAAPAAAAGADEWSIGRRVDVYSNSRSVWCPGVIYQVPDDRKVTVQYKVPSGEIQQKTLKKASRSLRLAQKSTSPAASPKSNARSPSAKSRDFSPAEVGLFGVSGDRNSNLVRSKTGVKVAERDEVNAELFEDNEPPSEPAPATPQQMESRGPELKFYKDDAVQVWSTKRATWVGGAVFRRLNNGKYEVVLSGSGAHVKVDPYGDRIRRDKSDNEPAVEVPDVEEPDEPPFQQGEQVLVYSAKQDRWKPAQYVGSNPSTGKHRVLLADNRHVEVELDRLKADDGSYQREEAARRQREEEEAEERRREDERRRREEEDRQREEERRQGEARRREEEEAAERREAEASARRAEDTLRQLQAEQERTEAAERAREEARRRKEELRAAEAEARRHVEEGEAAARREQEEEDRRAAEERRWRAEADRDAGVADDIFDVGQYVEVYSAKNDKWIPATVQDYHNVDMKYVVQLSRNNRTVRIDAQPDRIRAVDVDDGYEILDPSPEQAYTNLEPARQGSQWRPEYKRRITELYEQHNPTRIDKVDEFLDRYENKEDTLYRKICSQYNLRQVEDPPAGYEEPYSAEGRVTVAAGCIVRQRADISADNPRIRKLEDGTRLKIVARAGNRLHITAPVDGWISEISKKGLTCVKIMKTLD